MWYRCESKLISGWLYIKGSQMRMYAHIRFLFYYRMILTRELLEQGILNMTNKYPESEARDRSEMKCPSCFTTGLEEKEKIAKFYDSKEEQIIYGSKCPNENCDIGQIPPEEARTQLDTGFSLSVETLISAFQEFGFRTLAAMCALFLLAGILMIAATGLPIDLGNSGSATASTGPYTNISSTDNQYTLRTYQETGNWTIYSYGDRYLVAGTINEAVRYLDPQGETRENTYYFGNISSARDAILAWETKHQENRDQYPGPTTANNSIDQNTSWGIYEHNNSYVVAGKHNNSVVYLYPNGTYSESPYIFANYSDAEDAILNWESNKLDSGDLPDIDPADETEVGSDLNNWDPEGDDWSPDDHKWDDDDEKLDLDETNTSSVQETHTLQGTVYDSDDNTVSGGTVYLHSSVRTTTTDQNGSYTFHNVTPGNHTVYFEPPNGTDLAASDEVPLRMYSNGSVRVLNDPKNAIYFEKSDGTIAKNQIQLLTQEAQPIKATGQGSNIATTLKFEQELNAKNVSLTLEGLYTESKQSHSINGHDNGTTLDISGNQQPTDQRIALSAIPKTHKFSTAGTYTGTSPTINIRGNQKPANATVQLTGSYSTSSNHNRFETEHAYSGDTLTKSTSIGGNLQPTNAQVQVTGKQWYGTYTGKIDRNTYGEITEHDTFEDKLDCEEEQASGKDTAWEAPSDGTYEVQMSYRFKTYEGGCLRYDLHGDIEAEIDLASEDIVSASGYGWDDEDYVKKGTETRTVQLEKGDSVHTHYEMEGPAISEVDVEAKKIAKDPGTVTVDVNGEKYRVSGVDRGETKSISIGNLQTDGNTIKITSSNGDVALGTDLTWTERIGTENPQVEIGGTSICQKDGVLTGSMQCDIPTSDINPGQYTLGIQTDRGSAEYNLTYHAQAVPTNGVVEIAGTEYTYSDDFDQTGPMPSDPENQSRINISALELGINSISIESNKVDGIQTEFDAALFYTGEARRTYQPSVIVTNADGETHSKDIPEDDLQNGTLHGTVTMDLPAEWFSEGQNTIRVNTADSSQVHAIVEGSGLTYQYNQFQSTATNTTD